MKTSTTLVLAAVAAGIFASIHFYETQNPGTRALAERQALAVPPFGKEAIDGIDITTSEEKIELRRRGASWELEEPVKDRADQALVAEILGWCEMLQREETFPPREVDKKQLKTFGVSKPNLRLKLRGKGAPPELLFGKEAAVEGRSYLRLDGSNEVVVVNNALRNVIARKADEFRDHRLFDLQGPHVFAISIQTPAGEIALEKQAGHWNLLKPLKARASDRAAESLIASVLGLPILSFAPGKGANLNRYGLGEPAGVVTLQTLSRDEPVKLEIGAAGEKGRYARVSSRGAICLLPEAVSQLLAVKPNELRDKALLRLEPDLVDRITLQEAGRPKLILQRKLEEWTFRSGDGEARPANRAKVEALLREIRTREVAAFVSDAASDLAPYGLDEPRLRVTFSSYASETTAESAAGEAPIATVAFGKAEGGNVYARVEGEPFVVAVPEALAGEAESEPELWRALSIFRLKPEAVTSLERAPKQGAAVSLMREGGQWKSAEGARAVSQTDVESLVNTLARLTAVRWIGPGREALGTPEAVLTFKTEEGETRRLFLGPLAGDGTRLASIDNDQAVFAISAPDESALRLPLVIP